jgi:3-oxoacyl-[acyl-carrier protein] reductase
MDLGIDGKRVLITGASQGLGASIAKLFSESGAKVSIISRRKRELQEIVNSIGGENKGHSWHVYDLMEKGAPTHASLEILQKHGSVDIIVHNLGGTLNVKDPLSPVNEWYRVWTLNVGIAIEMNSILIPKMIKQSWGRVIHISSISAETVRGSSPYAASKAYLNAYTKGIGRSLAQQGIVVSAIMPGAFISEGGHWDNIKKNNPEMMHDFLRHHHAIGRLGNPDEIAPFVLFLSSKFVTFAQGTIVNVDGGTM